MTVTDGCQRVIRQNLERVLADPLQRRGGAFRASEGLYFAGNLASALISSAESARNDIVKSAKSAARNSLPE